ncbi:hypothetical protein LCGC14_0523100 [marine sediment metagenome]|uniref:HNH nuclease domain-containing protein n=1 Tax=marine sediment metagenome TaxID=412755 RepID=A0A0F9S2Q9_9ZZZZ
MGTVKICTKCGETKSLTNEFFQWRADRGSWRATCKICIKAQKQVYNKKNIEKQQKDKKRYYLANQERIKNKRKNYYNDNKEKVLKCNKLWNTANSEKMSEYHSSKRGESITKYLPYSIDKLKKHIESQWETWMNWDNYGKYKLDSWNDNDSSTWKWNIDHIVPRSALVYDSMMHANFCKCWALDNLRPVSAKENLYKGSKRI